MPTENFLQNKNYKSLENLKKIFKERLNNILNKQLTVENIEIFANEALDETIQLTEDILKEYRNNPNVFPNVIPVDKQEQENKAFEKLDLPDIPKILESINEVQEEIESLKNYININTEYINTVITPPQPDYNTNIKLGDGSFKNKETFPRMLTLFYILKHDFDIDVKNLPKPKEGNVTDKMMRKTPYIRVDIPELNRAVYICEEEGNVSYVFDTEKIKEVDLTLDEVDIDHKGDKNSLIAYHPGIGVRIIQTKNWRTNVARALGEKIPKADSNLKEEHEKEERETLDNTIPTVSRGEFDPWKGFWEEEGKHLAPIGRISSKLERTHQSISSIVTLNNLNSIRVVGLDNKPNDAYSYEKILEFIPENIKDEKRPEKSGGWKGFWVDPTGKHWGSIGTISKKIHKSYLYIQDRLKSENLHTINVKDLSLNNQNGYCFEEILEIFPDLNIQERIAEKKGEWRGFWLDTETNKHFGTVDAILKKCDITHSSWNVIDSYIRKANLQSVLIQSLGGRNNTKAYSYEDLLENNDFLEFMTAPQVDKEGEWKGFLTDDNENHWAPVNVLIQHLGNVDNTTLRKFLNENKFATKKIRNLSGEVFPTFCLEDLKANPNFMEFIKLPQAVKEGQWKGFWVDEEGNHWGSDRNISKILGVPRSMVKKFCLTHKIIRSMSGFKFSSLCLEEIKANLEKS